MLLNFTGDYRSFEHVLTHEMVHAFQYDIFARGKAGNGLRDAGAVSAAAVVRRRHGRVSVARAGSDDHDVWMRDAALFGKIPTIEQLTTTPTSTSRTATGSRSGRSSARSGATKRSGRS